MRADDFRDDWVEHQRQQSERAEEECSGQLWRRDVRWPGDRYTAFHMLWLAPPQNACKIASEELLQWWSRNGRLTFAEYVYNEGVRNVKINQRARRAPYTTATAIREGLRERTKVRRW